MPIRGPGRAPGDGGADDPLDPAQISRVRAVLALGGVPRSDLADGVQQIRLRLLERRADGREPPRDVGAWAAVVASHLAADWHRTRTRHRRTGARLAQLRVWSPQAPDGPEARLLALTVADGLDALPPLQRQVLVLRFYADLTVPRIARELGVPEGTVKSRLHAAAKSMRARLHVDEVV
ncbi:sigma-70 family RNA polymerase sigma factor [Streptomyces sp. NPDC001985]|uniref:sigma-70 family RNA polymerase sigma factor n=1 Tax=Streptomyces sp. NPDC001985 TaxID=3154406 RepID=UPI00332C370C